MGLNRDLKTISSHYKNLVKMSSKNIFLGLTNEKLVDNYYLLIEYRSSINSFLYHSENRRYINENNKLYKFLLEFLEEQNYNIDYNVFVERLNNFQVDNNYNLSYKEINMLLSIINIIIVRKISAICCKEASKLKDLANVKKVIKLLSEVLEASSRINLEDYLEINENTSIYFIEYFNEHIKDLNNNANKVFKQFNSLLLENNMSLREIINAVHVENSNSNLTINNVFECINKNKNISKEDLFLKLNAVEKILNAVQYFPEMTVETKKLYRDRVSKLAKKKKMSSLEYANQYLKNNKDIESLLFNNKNNRLVTPIYISLVILLSVIVSYFLTSLFLINKLLAFFCLIIPVSEIVISIVKYFFVRLYKSKPLPKMDFSEYIPDDCKTMIVVPTIIKDADKIKKVFDNLESFHIMNKKDNLYYALIGDCMEYDKEVHDNDKKIIEASYKIVDELNKKYGKEIFFFAYRKRQYNKSEESWLGYERKRGALLNFNDLLLGSLTKQEEEKYFNAHNFYNFNNKIKYVITLDVDTKLCLSSVSKLIGAMAHPLNRPVLDKKKNCVVSGYAIMQPKISVDIVSTNKSQFSQIYAGTGGFDSYSYVFADFYQDVFKEGTFVGKGIYDLEVYQSVLKGCFPNNQILSHDLIEGSYLRCADVLDADFMDDFPTKFLVDASRRSRWARGDFQIIGWLKNNVRNEQNKKVKNPISLISKWKIFDNIRRALINLFLVIIIILSLAVPNNNSLLVFLLCLLVIVSPVMACILEQFSIKQLKVSYFKYHNLLIYGNKATLVRIISTFAFIPYDTYLYISSFVKSAYRMLVSKKKLLNWITSEDAEKYTDSSYKNIIKQFWPNYLVSIIIIILSYFNSHNIIGYTLVFIFLLGPIMAYLLSKDIVDNKKTITIDDKKYLEDLARETWHFFSDNMNPGNNYLIPDNYQINRDYKADNKTSSTNIGLSLVSIVSACELGFINEEEAISMLNNVINTINKLAKWNGHLYNWYNIETLEVLKPSFISGVDSGNFIASLIVVKEFLKKHNDSTLVTTISDIIDNTNFKFLCDSGNFIKLGYNDDDGKLTAAKYDRIMSECRIASYVAIAKGDISSKNWFVLDKTLTTYKCRKGVISWFGTSFEYFMPLIFMKNYANTLLDESYHFAYYAQKEYMLKINRSLPWGVSESAYNELDDSQNYKYKAFGIPALRIRQETESQEVIAPYGSILAITEFPKDVIKNIKKYDKINMRGIYGLYESYDVNNKMPVYSFFAHHQGMILSSLANCIKDGVIQNYFASDERNKVYTILSKEKVQFKPIINVKINRYKKYNYQKESFENDVRTFYSLSTLPELSVLSNSEYSLIINDRGNGYSKYNNIRLNRYRKITEQDYGMFVYIKDIDSGKVWSNTYAPINKKPKKYKVVFALDCIKYVRTDDDIVTTTEIIVTKMHHAEIRKITFKNNSDTDKILELTTYTEPIIAENMVDITHRVYNNLFIESKYNYDKNAIIITKNNRDSKMKYYMASRLLIDNPLGEYEYETNRLDFIGRGRNTNNPIALERKLASNNKTSLEPIISLRNKINVPSDDEVTVYLINTFGKSYAQILDTLDFYSKPSIIDEKGFKAATMISNATTKLVEMTAMDMHLYNTMLNYLLQSSHIGITDERKEILKENVLSQSNLWRYGISGDRPIILLEVKDLDDLSLVKELLRAYEYYKSRAIFVDLVIINSQNVEYADIISKEIETEKYHMYAINNFYRTPGNIYILKYDDVNDNERKLLNTVSRLKIDSSIYNSLKYYIDDLQKRNTISGKLGINNVNSLPIAYDKNEMMFYNDFGGFTNNGKEYQIVNNNTPQVWSNVIANNNFGTLTTNNNAGFTYAYNSREYKLTSWTNDILLNDFSEGIRINDNNILFNVTKFGFGYSAFFGRLEGLDIELTEFVALNQTIKFYKLKLKNTSVHKRRVELKYWLNPNLGVTEEKTSRHLLSNYHKDNNYISLRNAYNKYFNDVNVFMTVTRPIETVDIDRILFKEFTTSLYIDSKQEEEIVFMLGCGHEGDVLSLINKYNTIKNINDEFNLVKEYWHKKLDVVQVKTPNESFNYMINGWLLYQTISSRINARAGFYQVSGAYGFRDQLQDAMNICVIDSETTKKQILFNAKHQFKEGDVMHWWHEENKIGIRSLYKDDYLWLIYAVYEYINVTGDWSILDEKIPFIEGSILEGYEKERILDIVYSDEEYSLYEHCQKAITKAMQELGSNGLPLMGGGDWNDGMNMVGINGQGTSVWLGFFLYQMVDYFMAIMKTYLPHDNIDKYVMFNNKLKKAILDVAWDGKQYLRAFFDNGIKLGSISNKECQIDLLSQSFAILTDIATPEQKKAIIKSVEEKLVDKDNKIIKLLDPAFESNEDNPGYIMSYPKGVRENGGQYTHSVSWYIMALIKEGLTDKAFEYYQMINPINRTLTKEDVLKYKVEPYVLAADIYSNKDFETQGGWTWYTGSSGWFYHVGLVDILGFNKKGNKLYIKPHIPSSWDKYQITYQYLETTYIIDIIKDTNNEIYDDNKLSNNDYIELINDKKTHNIVVKIGG